MTEPKPKCSRTKKWLAEIFTKGISIVLFFSGLNLFIDHRAYFDWQVILGMWLMVTTGLCFNWKELHDRT